MKKKVPDFRKMKEDKVKISMITTYDFPMARLVESAGMDCILVGDSAGMAVLGYDSTVPVTMEEMLHFTKPVCRGATQTFVVSDLPFLSYKDEADALINAGRLLKEGGADAVKLEGGQAQVRKVRALTDAGIPVVAHIGLTPQTASQLGGFKVQGKNLEDALMLLDDAKALQEAGAFMIVLEAIPEVLGEKITQSLSIPTIGIGAGRKCDGQVLVIHDLLGLFDRFQPKFVKQYANLSPQIADALSLYNQEVKSQLFPGEEHCFLMESAIARALESEK